MSRPLRIPRPETPLHLYRHLLRESSYLPPFARVVVDGRIRNRFRRHQESERVELYLRQGNHELRAIRAAVAGDHPRMYKLIMGCFGRTGFRRRELLDALLRKETPVDSAELEKYTKEARALASASRKKDWLDEWDLKKALTFATSQTLCCEQVRKPGQPLQGKQLHIKSYIPDTNLWGSPLSEKSVHSKSRKAWKRVADRVLPPLPPSEWDMLRDLASGKGISPEWAYTRRRALGQTLSGIEEDAHPWRWRSYATKAVAAVDYQANKKNKLLSGALDDNSPFGDPQPLHCHKWTPKRWQRLLEQVWHLTAKMTKKADGSGWDITWGMPMFTPLVADAAEMEFFEDVVHQKGRLVKQAVGRAAKKAASKATRAIKQNQPLVLATK